MHNWEMIRYWEIILNELQKKDLSQADLARELDVRRSVIHNWIKFDRYPKADQSHRISVYLSLPEDQLFSNQDKYSYHTEGNDLTVSESRSEYTHSVDSHKSQELNEILLMIKQLDNAEYQHVKGILEIIYSSKMKNKIDI